MILITASLLDGCILISMKGQYIYLTCMHALIHTHIKQLTINFRVVTQVKEVVCLFCSFNHDTMHKRLLLSTASPLHLNMAGWNRFKLLNFILDNLDCLNNNTIKLQNTYTRCAMSTVNGLCFTERYYNVRSMHFLLAFPAFPKASLQEPHVSGECNNAHTNL